MALFDSLSKPFVRLIQQRAAANEIEILNGIKQEAAKWRPEGHRALSVKRRHYYEGKQLGYLREVLSKNHPIRGAEMVATVLNYVRLIADQDSDAFRGEVTFEVADVDEQPDDFVDLVRSTRLVRVLKECERRLMIARSMFLRSMYNPVLGRVVVDQFWPSDIDIVPHPGAPTSIEGALAICARVSGGAGSGKKCYEVWTREDVGQPFQVSRIDEDGNETLILESGDGRTWPGETHPFCAWHVSDPEGTPYVDDDHDLLDMQDTINAEWTLLGEMIRFQAASALVYSGTDDGIAPIGSGLVTRVSPGESISVLDFNAKLDQVRETIKTQTRALAVTRRQNPDAYAEEPGPPLSGVSRRIQNQPQEEAREERLDHAKEMVEENLLPKLVMVSNLFTGTNIQADRYVFTPSSDEDFEDPDIRQRRILEQLSEKLISKPRAAVDLRPDLYESEEEAAEKLAEMSAAARPVIPPSESSRFGQRVLEAQGRAEEEG